MNALHVQNVCITPHVDKGETDRTLLHYSGTNAVFLNHVKVGMRVVLDEYISEKNMAHVKSFRVCVKIALICRTNKRKQCQQNVYF